MSKRQRLLSPRTPKTKRWPCPASNPSSHFPALTPPVLLAALRPGASEPGWSSVTETQRRTQQQQHSAPPDSGNKTARDARDREARATAPPTAGSVRTVRQTVKCAQQCRRDKFNANTFS